tara:strand:+ start:1313 stop:1489 length:177 start_codon:yes stop_codon:yes gene_type:complete
MKSKVLSLLRCYRDLFHRILTPGSPGKFLMAAFVRPYAQKMTAEIYPVQLIVSCTLLL